MSFWKENTSNPTRKFRFKILGTAGENDDWYWAKSVDKPSYEINSQEYLLINHKFKYPGVLTWNDITITMVDFGISVVEQLNGYLKNHKYEAPNVAITGIEKRGYDGNNGMLEIQQLDSSGVAIERWKLHNSFIKSVKYGDLAYESDDLVQIDLTISFDYATFEKNSN